MDEEKTVNGVNIMVYGKIVKLEMDNSILKVSMEIKIPDLNKELLKMPNPTDFLNQALFEKVELSPDKENLEYGPIKEGHEEEVKRSLDQYMDAYLNWAVRVQRMKLDLKEIYLLTCQDIEIIPRQMIIPKIPKPNPILSKYYRAPDYIPSKDVDE